MNKHPTAYVDTTSNASDTISRKVYALLFKFLEKSSPMLWSALINSSSMPKKSFCEIGKVKSLSKYSGSTVISDYEPLDPMLSPSGLIEKGKAWAGDADVKDYRLSPIYGNLQGLPPIVLFAGTHEIILPDARKLNDLACDSGVDITYYEYYGMNHAFPLFSIPEADKAFEQIQIQLSK